MMIERSLKTTGLFVLAIILLLLSCAKEEKYKTIKPGSYLPVYPNSYWKYLISDGTIIMDSTGDDYELLKYPCCNYEGYYYVPRYYAASGSPLGYNGPIYGYDKVIFEPKRGPGSVLWPILSEKIGYSFWATSQGTGLPDCLNERVTVEAKIFNGKDSILIISGIYNEYNGNDSIIFRRHREYTKYVGISKDIVIDTLKHDTISKKLLIDYYIGSSSH
jgi:hypothetical protein